SVTPCRDVHIHDAHDGLPSILLLEGLAIRASRGSKRYRENEVPERFERIVQSWDTANKRFREGTHHQTHRRVRRPSHSNRRGWVEPTPSDGAPQFASAC